MNKGLLSLFLLSLGLAQAQTPSIAAGTVLRNQVSADAIVLEKNLPIHAESNMVSTVIAPVCSVSITSGSTSSSTILPTEAATFTYTVRNTGNDTYTLPLSVKNLGSGNPQYALYQDTNLNGKLDATDAAITQVTLAAGQSATVFVVVQTTQADQGNIAAGLVAQCGVGGPSFGGDSAVVSHVVIAPPPIFSIEKAFGVTSLRPGDTTNVTVTVRNTGASGSRQVMVTDPLSSQIAQGLSYQKGSAKTTAGTLEYSSDGVTWSAAEPDNVWGLRLRLDSLAAAAEARVTFTVKAEDKAEDRNFINVATLTSTLGGNDLQASATLRVKYNPAVKIGPVGNPTAEGAADSQSVAFALTGKETCFDHTVKNTGDVADNFSVNVSYSAGSATAIVRGAGGQALTQPFNLAPQATTNVQVCYTPTMTQGGQPLTATVTVQGERKTSDPTTDHIDRVETQLPTLNKTVTKDGDAGWQSGGRVGKSDTLTYTLTVTNPYNTALTNVKVSDPVPAHLMIVGTPAGSTVAGNTVTWTVDTLAPGESRTFSIPVQVTADSKDDEEIRNVFNITTKEIPQPIESNAVTAYVWNSIPQIFKKAQLTDVSFGDQIPYTLTLKNISPSSPMTKVEVIDTPAKGLEYISGTSQLDGKPIADPAIAADGTMLWMVDRIDANGQRLLTYTMRVTPEARGDLINSVVMDGYGASGKVRAVASSRASTKVKLKLLNFAPQADIVGTVFVDNDGNGKPEQNDLTLSGARVILAGGRISLTDAKGRFHFGNVALGTQALRLDLASVPYDVTATSPATRTVNVNGLTTVNFALKANQGAVGRSIVVQQGDVTLTKTVSRVLGGYAVKLDVQAARDLSAFSLQDSLPVGATLQQGQPNYSGPLKAGVNTFEYRYLLDTAPAASELLKAPVMGVNQ